MSSEPGDCGMAASLSVHVHLISGRTVSLDIEENASVEALRQRASSALAVGRGKLVNAAGNALEGAATLREARIQSGDLLMLHVRRVEVIASKEVLAETTFLQNASFAAILADGSVATWGNAVAGGDSASVQDRLENVQHVQASGGLLVVSWNKVTERN